MNRDMRNCHYQSVGTTNQLAQSPFLSFMQSTKRKISPKCSPKTFNPQPHLMRNYTSLVTDDSISFAAHRSPQKTPNSQKNIKPYKFPSNLQEKTPSTYHHSQSGKSANGSVSNHLIQSRNFQKNKDSGQIYQEIIKILELENHNIKEQNKYMLGEYKKMVNENSKLKHEVESLKGYCGLKLEVEKLREINQTYQRLVEELKHILMEQMVAIHQKINIIMSSQEVTSVYNELEASLKKSTQLLNTEGFSLDLHEKQQNLLKLRQGKNLAEMLSLEENVEKTDRIGTYETFESISNSNRLSSSKYEKSVCDSPTEATFY